ncbi:S-protein homolog 3-like [Chenopodium quinoa]|uniref:S-protein homolog 3-like n=1 Tax=Chenopodium quinoa TaxID=63459 RepID=UPI000B7726EB|nr:S-protein homolog 3-like [Chenopodium quinoa]
MLKLFLSLFVVLCLANFQYVEGWSMGPGDYQVVIVNGLNDILWVHCKSGDKDLQLQKLPKSGNYSFNIHSSMIIQRLYFCGLTWDNHGRKVFDAFVDEQEFVDRKCGGRHCIWKAQDDAKPDPWHECMTTIFEKHM